GIVYLAEQESPRRTVALKLIRPGIASRAALRRFKYEADVLGRLHHPYIAQIYEAGTADVELGVWEEAQTAAGDAPAESDVRRTRTLRTGAISTTGARAKAFPDEPPAQLYTERQAFVAMEYIDGPPITTFAEQAGLAIRDRLELMARVCEGVQHAHQKGIIHRDLKPANILVMNEGIEGSRDQGIKATAHASSTSIPRSLDPSIPQPKILDFGIARAADPSAAQTTLLTGVGQLVGTLPYMSPEQLAGDADAIDIRSDVYSLGVLLFELLAGRLPYDVAGHTIPNAMRIIHDQPLPRLSGANRALRGEIETIVGKALEKDKLRRYQSAAELGE